MSILSSEWVDMKFYNFLNSVICSMFMSTINAQAFQETDIVIYFGWEKTRKAGKYRR